MNVRVMVARDAIDICVFTIGCMSWNGKVVYLAKRSEKLRWKGSQRKMNVYCMEDYNIRIRNGKSVPTGSFYIARNGKKKMIMDYAETYKTDAGEFSPEDWKKIVKRYIEAAGAEELLRKIIEHCRTNCVWLKTEKEREEYAMNILIGRHYRHWKDFTLDGMVENTVFVFNFSKEELCGGLRKVRAEA